VALRAGLAADNPLPAFRRALRGWQRHPAGPRTASA